MATPKPKPTASVFAPIVDELGQLIKDMAPHAQKLARIETLKKAMRAGCTAKPAEQETVEGARFVCVLGPCANQRLVDFPKLIKTIGAVLYSKFATCTLQALTENVAPAVAAAVITESATGPRPLKTFEKGVPV